MSKIHWDEGGKCPICGKNVKKNPQRKGKKYECKYCDERFWEEDAVGRERARKILEKKKFKNVRSNPKCGSGHPVDLYAEKNGQSYVIDIKYSESAGTGSTGNTVHFGGTPIPWPSRITEVCKKTNSRGLLLLINGHYKDYMFLDVNPKLSEIKKEITDKKRLKEDIEWVKNLQSKST